VGVDTLSKLIKVTAKIEYMTDPTDTKGGPVLIANPNLPHPIKVGDEETQTVPARGRVERWLDKHNHKMELIRTLTSAIAAVASTIVLFIMVL